MPGPRIGSVEDVRGASLSHVAVEFLTKSRSAPCVGCRHQVGWMNWENTMCCGSIRLHALSIALFLICRIAASQVANVRLEGTVRDPSGAVVPLASVSVLNNNTEVRTDSSTSAEGFFLFQALQPGFYTLMAAAPGFRQTVVRNLELTVGATVVENVTMELGNVTENIEVVASWERVQLTDAQIGRAVTLREIDVLPQLGRGPMTLGLFSAGVQQDPGNPMLSRVNGSRHGSNHARLDGVEMGDSVSPRLLMGNNAINVDSVEEFHIITSGSKAEYGRVSGGQIQLITRSGTNDWHGNLFEYHRSTALNASSFFGNSSGLPRPQYIQNTFGASLGGPIRRGSTFVFGNYQGRRTAQEVVRIRTVLTPEAKAGLFRWKVPGTEEIRTFDIFHNDPRGKGMDPTVAEILKWLPDPNDYSVGDGLNTAGFRFNNPSLSSVDDMINDSVSVRADHTLWSGHRLFFRFTRGHPWIVDAITNNDARFPGQPAGIQGGVYWSYAIGSDWSISPRLMNELRVGYKYYSWDWLRPARLADSMLLSNSWTDPLNPAFAQSRKTPLRQITDNFTIDRKSHIFKIGFEGRFTTERSSSDGPPPLAAGSSGIWPNVRFATGNGNDVPVTIGPSGTGISKEDRQRFANLYNDLLGRMSQVTQTFYSDLQSFQPAGTPRVRNFRYREYGGFFQDDWKVLPRLSLNLGLRYEFFDIPVETSGIQGTLDKAGLINSAARLSDLTIQPGSRWAANDFNNFAPRIGLAWDPTGSGRTALRASWGVYYDRRIGATTSSVDANTPGFTLSSVSVYPNAAGADFRVSDGIPVVPHPDVPELRPPPTRSTDLFLFAPNLRTGYVQQFNLTLQREIFRNTVLEAAYVGNRGIRLFMDINLNQPRIYEDFLPAFRELQAYRASGIPVSSSNTLVRIFGSLNAAVKFFGGTLDTGAAGDAADSMDTSRYTNYAQAGVSDFYLRNFPQFNRVILGTNDGRSYYDSFQLTLRRQGDKLKMIANYTFSKSIDNISAEGNGFTSPIDNFNLRLNRARSDFDTPHALNSSVAYTLPIGKGRRFASNAPRWVDSLVGGWDVGLLAVWQSGQAVTYLSGRATGPTRGNSNANYSGDRNIGRIMREADGVYWLTAEEISRFFYPLAGEIGTGGRNAFRGPRYFNVDMSLVKKFKMSERHSVSIRCEAYNLFNNVNFKAPNNNLSTPGFGRISETVGNPRFLQLALRYVF
jgi:hypothetical protein